MKKAKKPISAKDSLGYALRAAMTVHQSGKIHEAVQLYRSILQRAPNQTDALHYLGVAQHQLGNKEEAIVLMRRALQLDPDYVDAQNNLGNVLKENGQVTEAEQSYRTVIAARPEFALAYNNLGVVLATQRRFVDAISAYRQCLALQPDYAQAWHNLGNALKKNADIDEALTAYRQAIFLAPYNASAYQDLGNALAMQKRFDEALSVFQHWLTLEPENPVIHHMIAAYQGAVQGAAQGVIAPQRASDGYVQKTFDSFAETFDAVLGNLDYHAPALVGEKLAQLLGMPQQSFDILDAGCGTGLCAAYLKPYARYLEGVDLSAGMLVKAAMRDSYDKLQQAELTAFLTAHPDAFNCIVCADTLCYFGALDVFMENAALALRAGSYLVFTLEHTQEHMAKHTLDSDTVLPYVLHPHGRYSHTENYVRKTMQAVGLRLYDISYVTLRTESDQPVHGLLVAAMK